MSKIKHIVLIDDHEATNFYHKYILERSQLTEQVSTVDNVQDALILLKKLCAESSEHQPCLVFLDINLPRYTGFEFIAMHRELMEELKANGVRLFLLSSSQNPRDIEAAAAHPLIEGFLEKPLSVEKVNEILDEIN